MARIKNIVEKAKLSDDAGRAAHFEHWEGRGFVGPIEYTQTQVVPVENYVLDENLVIAHKKEDVRATLFQMLRAKVLKELRANDWNSIAITAPTPGAGASLMTVNLAISMAKEANQSVIIADLDLRNPSIHHYFGCEPGYGIQDYFENEIGLADILINPGIDRLVILPGRDRVLNSSERLSSPKLHELAEELKLRYDSRVVLFDLPPLLVSDDAMVFLPCADCSLLVVESGVNTKEEVEESIRLLDSKPILGTVFNKDKEAPRLYSY